MCKSEELLVLKSLELAAKYHAGQIDKAGVPYIEHCIRVGVRAGAKGKSEEETRILTAIGFLHDILEDTELTEDELMRYIKNEKVVETVLLLTKIEGQTYFHYIDEIAGNYLATLVKLADIEDHLEHKNGYILPESLLFRYQTAKKQLMDSKTYLKYSSSNSSI